MGRSFLGKTKEQVGHMPKGAFVFEISKIERTKTGPKSRVPGCRMYAITLKSVEPEDFAGFTLMDYAVVGTEDDPKAIKAESWQRSEGGPGRLKRLLVRSGTPESDEDKEWMADAESRRVGADVSIREDDTGRLRNQIDLYYTEEEIADRLGPAEDSDAPRGGRKERKQARKGRKVKEEEMEEDEDEEEEEEQEEDEDKEDEDEEEGEEEEEDEESEESEDDEDEEEEDDKPSPPRRRARPQKPAPKATKKKGKKKGRR